MIEDKSIGEIIDSLDINDLIRRDDFVSLSVFNGIEQGNPDYWELTFKSKREGNKLFSILGQEVQHPLHKFFKTKIITNGTH